MGFTIKNNHQGENRGGKSRVRVSRAKCTAVLCVCCILVLLQQAGQCCVLTQVQQDLLFQGHPQVLKRATQTLLESCFQLVLATSGCVQEASTGEL